MECPGVLDKGQLTEIHISSEARAAMIWTLRTALFLEILRIFHPRILSSYIRMGEGAIVFEGREERRCSLHSGYTFL
jgi:hypothetical protein